MSDKFTCPRRTEGETGRDRWEPNHGLPAQRDEKSCSYCGSLNPITFMALVKDGWVVVPTDKPYKAYISRPLTDEEKSKRKAEWRREWREQAFRSLVDDDSRPTPDEVEVKLEEMWESHGQMQSWYTGTGFEFKFYYPHLSSDQRREFVDMYNDQSLVVGYPGFFYVLPYFAVEGEPVDDSGTSS